MPEALTFLIDRTATPIGELVIVADRENRLRAIDWTDHEDRMLRLLGRYYRPNGFEIQQSRDPGGLTQALSAYFAGDLASIDNLPIETSGTAFQRSVWKALREIPCGTTISYSELARRVGRPAAIRAVGLANGANPVSIVAPCHRVIGFDGRLTGYGGGIERKRWLLAHEGATTAETAPVLI
jgi:methylated-DNA-[protein]-cysteine S-methyltransferase